MILTVIKRDGRIVGFNEEKIKAAIRKAMLSTEKGEDNDLLCQISDRISYIGKEQMSVEEIRDYIHADTLRFMTEEEMKEATHGVGLCLACFNGEYCTKLFSYQEELDK